MNKLQIKNVSGSRYFGIYNKKNNKKNISYFRVSCYKKNISSFFKKTNLGNIIGVNNQKILSKLIEINRSLDNIPSELLTESNLYVVPNSITENSAIITINAYPWSYGSSIYYDYRGSIRVTFNENLLNQNLETQIEIPQTIKSRISIVEQPGTSGTVSMSKFNNNNSKIGEISQKDLEEAGPSGISNYIKKDKNNDNLNNLNINNLNIRFENNNRAILSINSRNENYFGEVGVIFSIDNNSAIYSTKNINNNNSGNTGGSSDEERENNKKIFYIKQDKNKWIKKDYSSEDDWEFESGQQYNNKKNNKAIIKTNINNNQPPKYIHNLNKIKAINKYNSLSKEKKQQKLNEINQHYQNLSENDKKAFKDKLKTIGKAALGSGISISGGSSAKFLYSKLIKPNTTQYDLIGYMKKNDITPSTTESIEMEPLLSESNGLTAAETLSVAEETEIVAGTGTVAIESEAGAAISLAPETLGLSLIIGGLLLAITGGVIWWLNSDDNNFEAFKHSTHNQYDAIEKYYKFLAHDQLKLDINSNEWNKIKQIYQENANNYQEFKNKIKSEIINFHKEDHSGWWGGSITDDDINTLIKVLFNNFYKINQEFLSNHKHGWTIVTNTIGSYFIIEEEK